MDGNNKNNFSVDPLPPVQVSSVHSCSVRVDSVRLDSVRVISAGIPYQLTNVTWRMEWLVLVDCL